MPQQGSIPAEGLELLERAIKRDTEAFGQLYDLYVDRVYRHVYYRLGDRSEAEDLTEEVFLRAWQSIERYRPQGVPFVAWLFKIAQNLVVDRYRHKRPKGEVLETETIETDVWADPVVIAEQHLTQQTLRQAVLRLKPEQQQVIMLRFLDGLEYPEVAAILGKSEGAVRIAQFRALQALRHILEGERLCLRREE
ncbi:MAG: sigma-70 family RNA polymerase sigma factor [Chloroflexi bacterium]|nr:sigma-70 family RNA polymerase sigma factor [Chloroflexota bacterium]MCL5074076.1 sigma-70 family RNA polymerase sigma factor [Chloroflexota bacterium]